MLITELQSRNMVCPIRDSNQCLGKRCMMWRYATKEQMIRGGAENVMYEGGESMEETLKSLEESFNENEFASSFHGYCGLAGTPLMKG